MNLDLDIHVVANILEQNDRYTLRNFFFKMPTENKAFALGFLEARYDVEATTNVAEYGDTIWKAYNYGRRIALITQGEK